MQIEIFTDGACRGNPGPGGWGVVIRRDGVEEYLKGGEKQTTNNRMELTAVIKALQHIDNSDSLAITTDSQYVKLGITQWIINWKKRNWRTSTGQSVKNVDLWQKLDALVADFTIEWHWVRGHCGHRENEIADRLAREAIDGLSRG